MREIKQRDKKGRFAKGHKLTQQEKNGNWKGGLVGYFALHNWVNLYLGKPKKCDRCGTTESKKYEWSNISGEYKRDTCDWERLCVSCHRKKDGHAYKMWETRRKQNA